MVTSLLFLSLAVLTPNVPDYTNCCGHVNVDCMKVLKTCYDYYDYYVPKTKGNKKDRPKDGPIERFRKKKMCEVSK